MITAEMNGSKYQVLVQVYKNNASVQACAKYIAQGADEMHVNGELITLMRKIDDVEIISESTEKFFLVS